MIIGVAYVLLEQNLKIKFYMGVKGTSLEDADKKLNELETAMREIANS